MSIRRLAVLLLLLFPALSCRETIIKYTEEPVEFAITSPKPGWTYYDDAQIMLAVNVDTDNITWTSDISGYLGRGNHCTVFLPEGPHRVSAEIKNVTKEQNVTILPGIAGGRVHSVLVNYSPLAVKLKKGSYYPFLYANEGSISNFRVSGIQGIANARQVPQSTAAVGRDIRLPLPPMGKRVVRAAHAARAAGSPPALGDKRTFFVINTQNQLGQAHEIEAELIHLSEPASVWVPASVEKSDLINECIQKLETLIIPRVTALWGKPADIDEDGRFAILFSQTLNDEGVAIGFFNPADFFARNDDTASQAYNPSSNEMDIMYVAVPQSDPQSSFTMENVIATIAHELAHACTFTAKTWGKMQNGESQAAREELFLDEGWSHLTESLCGLGISGGNIKFLERFFENTAAYSFCGPNRNGLDDSAGMRGAITLFLSWLFWRSGGMSWDSSDPLMFVDRGGIAFLQKMLALRETGWESIGAAYGRPARVLFNEMLDEMNRYRETGREHACKIDPVTTEAVDFFANMGEIGGITIGFPFATSVYAVNTLLPWSFVFFDPLAIPADSVLTLHFSKNDGSIFYSY